MGTMNFVGGMRSILPTESVEEDKEVPDASNEDATCKGTLVLLVILLEGLDDSDSREGRLADFFDFFLDL